MNQNTHHLCDYTGTQNYNSGHYVAPLRVLHHLNRHYPSRRAELVDAMTASVTLRFHDTGEETTYYTHEPDLLSECLEKAMQPESKIILIGGFLLFYSRGANGMMTGKPLNPLLEADAPCRSWPPRL